MKRCNANSKVDKLGSRYECVNLDLDSGGLAGEGSRHKALHQRERRLRVLRQNLFRTERELFVGNLLV